MAARAVQIIGDCPEPPSAREIDTHLKEYSAP